MKERLQQGFLHDTEDRSLLIVFKEYSNKTGKANARMLLEFLECEKVLRILNDIHNNPFKLILCFYGKRVLAGY